MAARRFSLVRSIWLLSAKNSHTPFPALCSMWEKSALSWFARSIDPNRFDSERGMLSSTVVTWFWIGSSSFGQLSTRARCPSIRTSSLFWGHSPELGSLWIRLKVLGVREYGGYPKLLSTLVDSSAQSRQSSGYYDQSSFRAGRKLRKL